MRSYIFTNHERKVLALWLKSEDKVNIMDVAMILSRVKHFTDLRNDVLLYNRVREKLGITQRA